MTVKTSGLGRIAAETALSISTLAVAVVMPQIFHYFGLGKEFLPMYLPLVVMAVVSGNRWGVLVPAVLAPMISLVLFGMPVLPVAVLVALELTLVVLGIGLAKTRKWNLVAALPVILIAGRAVSLLGNLVIRNGSWENSWSFTASAWPGILVLLAAGILTGLFRTGADHAK